MTQHITNNDRMTTFLSTISKSNEYMKVTHKKEYIKLYGEAAEIFEDALIPFIPKVLTYLSKKMKESDALLHTATSDSIGLIVHHCLKNVTDENLKGQTLKDVLKAMYTNMNSNDKKVQQAAGLCLT